MKMSLKENLLELLQKSSGEFLSGERAAETLGVSRTAVWKAVTSLKNEGYNIESVTNRGYRLSADTDVLSAYGINNFLGKQAKNYDISVLGTVTSTNALIKTEAAKNAPEGRIIIAAEQTAGRGRFGRSFFSPTGSGLYISILLRPTLPVTAAVSVTAAAAAAVAEAVETVSGKKAGIKWVNDVLTDNKKVCGILTEAALDVESGALSYAVLGIGVNVYQPQGGFPEDIKNKAGALCDTKQPGLKNRLAAEIITRFFGYYSSLTEKTYLNSYRARCIVPGKKITVLSGSEEIPALALGIDDDCRLLVKYEGGKEEYLSSGEISIRL